MTSPRKPSTAAPLVKKTRTKRRRKPKPKNLQETIGYEFHKWKKQLLLADKVITLVIISLLGFFSPEYVLMAAFVFTLIYLALTQRRGLLKHLAVAVGISVIWLLAAKEQYGYVDQYMTVIGYNLFPLFGWALGLLAMYVIYSHYEHWLPWHNTGARVVLFTVLYWPVLLIAEFVGYYILGIQNEATSMYAGLPWCDCMHAPDWMQAAYFVMGPLYFFVCYLLKLENPHSKKRQ